MNPIERTRLEKAASDCGFELTPEMHDGALALRSAQFPECVSVRPLAEETFVLNADESLMLPESSVDGLVVSGWDDLYQVLERASAIARTLPNRVADKFHSAIAGMPRSTEAERLVIQRIGQGLFRNALMDFWRGTCCMTGLTIPALLRASHIKPWASCDSDEERLDVFNGLLLAPHLDAVFDGGWITVEMSGVVRFAPELTESARKQLGLQAELAVSGLSVSHAPYLEFHRSSIFRG